MRILIASLIFATYSLCAEQPSAQVRMPQEHAFDIPSGDLGAAVEQFATQSGARVRYLPPPGVTLRTNGVHGVMDEYEAALTLLMGTGLSPAAMVLSDYDWEISRSIPQSDGSVELSYDIPAGDIETALEQFSKQSQDGMSRRLQSKPEKPIQAQAVKGILPRNLALRRLLRGTGLTVDMLNVAKMEPAAGNK